MIFTLIWGALISHKISFGQQLVLIQHAELETLLCPLGALALLVRTYRGGSGAPGKDIRRGLLRSW